VQTDLQLLPQPLHLVRPRAPAKLDKPARLIHQPLRLVLVLQRAGDGLVSALLQLLTAVGWWSTRCVRVPTLCRGSGLAMGYTAPLGGMPGVHQDLVRRMCRKPHIQRGELHWRTTTSACSAA
jgi:hypothetical protein